MGFFYENWKHDIKVVEYVSITKQSFSNREISKKKKKAIYIPVCFIISYFLDRCPNSFLMSVIFYKYFTTFLKPCNARYLHPTRSSCFWFVLMHCKCYKAFEVHAIEQFVFVCVDFLSTLDLPTLSYCLEHTLLRNYYTGNV